MRNIREGATVSWATGDVAAFLLFSRKAVKQLRPLYYRYCQFNGDRPDVRNDERHLERGAEAGGEDGPGKIHIKAVALKGFHRFKQIFLPGTVAKKPARLWLKDPLIDFVKLDKQPLVFVAFQDFFDRFRSFHWIASEEYCSRNLND
jgi:hypothetical protein